MAKLENKNVNPIVAVVANWFVFGILGYILLGQTKKGLMVVVATLIGTLLCCLPGVVVAVLGLIDVYQTAEAVQKGEEVDENQYKQELLYKIVSKIHKEAVFKA